MTVQQYPPQKPSIFSRLVGFLARLILVLLIAAGLAAALYWGIPALYRQFIQPVQDHTRQISVLETQQAKVNEQNTQRMSELQTRVEALELEADSQRDAIAESETELQAVAKTQAAAQAEVLVLQTQSAADTLALEDHLARLEQLQSDLETQDVDLGSAVDDLGASLKSIEVDLALLQEGQANAVTLSVLEEELKTLRLMNLVTRVRFFLAQNNIGLAEQDIRTGLTITSDLLKTASAERAELLVAVDEYLKSAQADLPAKPVSADSKLEVAWQILLYNQNVEIALPEVPLAAPTSTITPDVLLVLTETPTPTATPTPKP